MAFKTAPSGVNTSTTPAKKEKCTVLHLMKPGSAGNVDTPLLDHWPSSQKAHVAFSEAVSNLKIEVAVWLKD